MLNNSLALTSPLHEALVATNGATRRLFLKPIKDAAVVGEHVHSQRFLPKRWKNKM